MEAEALAAAMLFQEALQLEFSYNGYQVQAPQPGDADL